MAIVVLLLASHCRGAFLQAPFPSWPAMSNGEVFLPYTAFSPYSMIMRAGHMNADLLTDLVVVADTRLYLFLGNSTAPSWHISRLFCNVSTAQNIIYMLNISLADFDGDGNLDLAVIVEMHCWICYNGGPVGNQLAFTPVPVYAPPLEPLNELYWQTVSAFIYDIDNDGKQDVLALQNSNRVTWSRNLGASRTWATPQLILTLPAGEPPYHLMFGDVTGDAMPDLVMTSRPRDMYYFPATSYSATFAPRVNITSSFFTFSECKQMLTYDINFDGRQDLVCMESAIFYMLSNGTAFGDALSIPFLVPPVNGKAYVSYPASLFLDDDVHFVVYGGPTFALRQRQYGLSDTLPYQQPSFPGFGVLEADLNLDGVRDYLALSNGLSGSSILYALNYGCPALAPIPNGQMPLFMEVSQFIAPRIRNATCNAGYYPVGPTSRRCQQNGTWSHTPLFCALDEGCTIAAERTVLQILSSQLVVNKPATFRIVTRNASNALTFCAQTNASLVINGVALPDVALSLDGPGGAYTFTVTLPTTAGASTIAPRINGQTLPAQSMTLSPGVAVPLNTRQLVPLAFARQTSTIELVLRDAYLNEGATGSPSISASLSQGLLQATLFVTGHALVFTVPTAGVYSLASVVGGVALPIAFVTVEDYCPAGYQFTVAAAECTLCPAGTFSATALSGSCTSCPAAATTTGPGAITIANCTCMPGYWAPRATPAADPAAGVQCRLCPLGADCAGFGAPPVARPGYIATDDPSAFQACPLPASCRGGAGSPCARGYTGSLCARCASGYYKLGQRCLRCNNAQIAGVVIAVVVASLIGLAALVWFNSRTGIAHRFGALMITLTALQLCSLYGRLQLPWGALGQAWFDVASAFALNFELSSPECSLARGVDPFLFRLLALMLTPIAVVAGLAVVLAVGWLLRGTWKTLTTGALLDACVRTAFQLMLMLYLPLTGAALSVFSCTRDSRGVFRLRASPDHTCFDRSWVAIAVPGALFTVVYALGIPAATAAVLLSARRRMEPMLFALRFAFVVGRFEPSAWYFEIALMCTKLVFVLCLTAFSQEHSKATGAYIVLAASVMHLAARRPYAARFHNAFAQLVGGLTTLVLVGGTVGEPVFRAALVGGGLVCLSVAMVAGTVADFVRIGREGSQALMQADGAFGRAGPADGTDSELMSAADLKQMSNSARLSTSGGDGSGLFSSRQQLEIVDIELVDSSDAQFSLRI